MAKKSSRILSLLLAVTMLMNGSVWAFASEPNEYLDSNIGGGQSSQSIKTRRTAAKANDLVLNTYNAELFPEDTLQIEVWETPTNIPEGRVTEYFSDDTEVVTVDENGLITAVGPGKASVIVYYGNEAQPQQIRKYVDIVVYDWPDIKLLELEKYDIEILEGEDTKIEYKKYPLNAKGEVYFESEDTFIVSVDSEGYVKGIKEGKARVRVYCDTAEVWANITVKKKVTPVNELRLSKNNLILKENTSDIIEITRIPYETTDEFQYFIDDKSIVSIESQPKNFYTDKLIIKGIKPGVTTVYASCGNIKKEIKIEVKPILKDIHLNFYETSICLDYNDKIEVTKEPLDAFVKEEIVYKSSDEDIVKIESDGNIIPVNKGEADIYVTLEGITKTIHITTYEKQIVNNTDTLYTSETLQADISIFKDIFEDLDGINFISSDKTIATVDRDGKVTAYNPGKVLIHIENDFKTLAVNIQLTVKAIDFVVDKIDNLLVGDSSKISLDIDGPEGIKPIYRTEDTDILELNPDGSFVGLQAGEAEVEIQVGDVKKTVKIKVEPKLIDLFIDNFKDTMLVGEEQTISVIKNPLGAAGDIKFESKDASIATIDSTGKIVGISDGETDIIVTCNDITKILHIKVNKVKHTLIVKYRYKDGSKAEEDVILSLTAGDVYKVDSLEIEGYKADKLTIEGTMGDSNKEFIVTYEKKEEEKPSEDKLSEEKPNQGGRPGGTSGGWYRGDSTDTRDRDTVTPVAIVGRPTTAIANPPVIEINEPEVPLIERPVRPVEQIQETPENPQNREIIVADESNNNEGYTNIPEEEVPLTRNGNNIIEERQHSLCVWFYVALVLALINIAYILITALAKNNEEDDKRVKES